MGTNEPKQVSKMVEIELEEYENLLDCQAFLEALQEAGVDNWQGYDEARKLYQSR